MPQNHGGELRDRDGRDDVIAAAMIDRLVHHAEVLAFTGESYRTRARRELLTKNNDK